jgi:hypothetical protein
MNEIVRDIADLRRRLDSLERAGRQSAAPSLMGSVTQTMGGVRAVAEDVANIETGIQVSAEGVSLINYLYANFFRTTTEAANLHRSSTDAQVYLVSSMGFNKLDQADIDLADAEAVLDLAPKTWRDRAEVATDPDTPHRVPGFVAEEVRAASEKHGGALDPLITEGPDTQGTSYLGINYDRIPAYLIPLIRDLREKVVDLTDRLAVAETWIAAHQEASNGP